MYHKTIGLYNYHGLVLNQRYMQQLPMSVEFSNTKIYRYRTNVVSYGRKTQTDPKMSADLSISIERFQFMFTKLHLRFIWNYNGIHPRRRYGGDLDGLGACSLLLKTEKMSSTYLLLKIGLSPWKSSNHCFSWWPINRFARVGANGYPKAIPSTWS